MILIPTALSCSGSLRISFLFSLIPFISRFSDPDTIKERDLEPRDL